MIKINPLLILALSGFVLTIPAADSAQAVASIVQTKMVPQTNIPAIVASAIFIGWLCLVIVYYWWAIGYYNKNLGLSDHEWKVLHPDIYTKNDKEKAKYLAMRSSLNATPCEGQESNSAATTSSVLQEPQENPYQGESFGLPPGTIRGTLALTAMIGFFLVEFVNLFSPTNLEKDFSELLTVFQMVIAFYFGAKAVDIFTKKQDSNVALAKQAAERASVPTPLKESPSTTLATAVPAPKASIPVAQTPVPLPAEQPALPSSIREVRAENLTENQQKSSSVVTPAANAATAIKPVSPLSESDPLARRVLALTASFETGQGFPECFAGISGDFDQQGISYGALQWCIGQKSLQPLLAEVVRDHHELAKSIFSVSQLRQLEDMLSKPLADQLAWARSIQISKLNSKNRKVMIIQDDWKKALQILGTTAEMIAIQTNAAAIRYQKAVQNCKDYQCKTERAVAFFFDINVQNGHVNVGGVKEKVLADIQKLPLNLDATAKEIEVLRIIAHRRSEVCKKEWASDVLSRKLAIAEGKGTVHGKSYNIEDYFIGLKNVF